MHPSQFVPVLVSLLQEAVVSSSIRQELDEGWVLLSDDSWTADLVLTIVAL